MLLTVGCWGGVCMCLEFVYLRARERQRPWGRDRRQGKSRLPTEQGAQLGA